MKLRRRSGGSDFGVNLAIVFLLLVIVALFLALRAKEEKARPGAPRILGASLATVATAEIVKAPDVPASPRISRPAWIAEEIKRFERELEERERDKARIRAEEVERLNVELAALRGFGPDGHTLEPAPYAGVTEFAKGVRGPGELALRACVAYYRHVRGTWFASVFTAGMSSSPEVEPPIELKEFGITHFELAPLRAAVGIAAARALVEVIKNPQSGVVCEWGEDRDRLYLESPSAVAERIEGVMADLGLKLEHIGLTSAAFHALMVKRAESSSIGAVKSCADPKPPKPSKKASTPRPTNRSG